MAYGRRWVPLDAFLAQRGRPLPTWCHNKIPSCSSKREFSPYCFYSKLSNCTLGEKMIRKLIVATNQRSETLLSLLNRGGPIDQRPPADRCRNSNNKRDHPTGQLAVLNISCASHQDQEWSQRTQRGTCSQSIFTTNWLLRMQKRCLSRELVKVLKCSISFHQRRCKHWEVDVKPEFCSWLWPEDEIERWWNSFWVEPRRCTGIRRVWIRVRQIFYFLCNFRCK